MQFTNISFGIRVISVVLLLIFCCLCWCKPTAVSYRDSFEVTTPKLYKDKFSLRKEEYPANKSEKYYHISGSKFKPLYKLNGEFDQHNSLDKVKAVMPGENTMKESDDDDDDDDGGEYEGFDYYQDNKKYKNQALQQDLRKGWESPEEANNGQCKKKDDQSKIQDSMPMVIIREVDMVAMQIPLNNSQKTQKEWSQWSSCNKPCGNGVQTRWRLKPGLKEKEQQLRPCNLGDCESRVLEPRVIYD